MRHLISIGHEKNHLGIDFPLRVNDKGTMQCKTGLLVSRVGKSKLGAGHQEYRCECHHVERGQDPLRFPCHHDQRTDEAELEMHQ